MTIKVIMVDEVDKMFGLKVGQIGEVVEDLGIAYLARINHELQVVDKNHAREVH